MVLGIICAPGERTFYFGVESGNHVADKSARSGLTASKAETVDAPVINALRLLSALCSHIKSPLVQS